jgi:hypothetical protein
LDKENYEDEYGEEYDTREGGGGLARGRGRGAGGRGRRDDNSVVARYTATLGSKLVVVAAAFVSAYALFVFILKMLFSKAPVVMVAPVAIALSVGTLLPGVIYVNLCACLSTFVFIPAFDFLSACLKVPVKAWLHEVRPIFLSQYG